MKKTLQILVGGAALMAAFPSFASQLLTEDELQKAFAEAQAKYVQEKAEIAAQKDDAADIMKFVAEISADGEAQVQEREVFAAPEMAMDDVVIEPENNTAFSSDNHDVVIMSGYASMKKAQPDYDYALPLGEIRIAVNMEGVTLSEAVQKIVNQAEEKVGPWGIRWRLQPDNRRIMEEKVNLTAEATFGQFLDHLVDRVNNITGVQLFVSEFEASRILVISDSF